MNIEPSDVDKVTTAIVDGIVRGITSLASIAYEWYRKRTAPYYQPPEEVHPVSRWEDQPQAVYPEMERKESENEQWF